MIAPARPACYAGGMAPLTAVPLPKLEAAAARCVSAPVQCESWAGALREVRCA